MQFLQEALLNKNNLMVERLRAGNEKTYILPLTSFSFGDPWWRTGRDGETNDPIPSNVLTSDSGRKSFRCSHGRLIQDYGVHISMTFSASQDQSRRVAIIENPATGLAGVLMITDEQTCIAFSGEDRQGIYQTTRSSNW